MATKPKYPIPTTEAEAAALLGELGDLELEIDEIQHELDQNVQKLITESQARADKLSAIFAEKFNALKAYAKGAKNDLTDNGKRRSIKWGTGELGWRSKPAGISTSGKKEVIIARILALAKKSKDLMRFLRIKYELNLEAMEAEPEAASAIDGISIRQKSEIIYIRTPKGNSDITSTLKLQSPTRKKD